MEKPANRSDRKSISRGGLGELEAVKQGRKIETALKAKGQTGEISPNFPALPAAPQKFSGQFQTRDLNE